MNEKKVAEKWEEWRIVFISECDNDDNFTLVIDFPHLFSTLNLVICYVPVYTHHHSFILAFYLYTQRERHVGCDIRMVHWLMWQG